MYLRQVTYTYIIRKEDTVSMIPEYRFPLKRKCGFLHIGTPVSNLRNWGVKPPGILTIGWGYIKQDFTANVSSSRISSVSLVGSSYDTGFTLGSWEPNYSWTDISSNKQFVQIHMKGTINYLWEGLNISKDCTFLDTFKASGSSLVESSYLDWPD